MNAINLYINLPFGSIWGCVFFGIYSVLYGNMGYGGQFMVGFTISQPIQWDNDAKNQGIWDDFGSTLILDTPT